MTIGTGWGVLAAAGEGLFERWRDLGPALWMVAGGLAVTWAVILGLVAALTDPRRVRPGTAILELQGPEPPAVVNLVASDWELGHEAIPATLIDLAAKGRVAIDMVGDDTFVRVRTPGVGAPELTGYEKMVLDHVRDLADRTAEGRVPAAAMTTGPDHAAKRWWKRFRSSVVDDARRRGLSRPRWSAAVKSALVTAAVPVAVAAALAASTLPDDPADPDDDPIEASLAVGGMTFVGLGALAGSLSGERDTPGGRQAAARWLGLRELLEEDPLFAEQPPAAVAIWDHLLAHGTALGVAHGVVQALPLGAESEHEAWSPVGGRWRVVRVRYPRWLPPGYGLHPGLALLLGLGQAGIAALVLRGVQLLAGALLDTIRDRGSGPGPGQVPPEVRTAITAVAAVLVSLAGLVALRAVLMALAGLADLVAGRTTVEGRVLRVRDRVRNDRVTRHMAVDDGTAARVRAWKFGKRVAVTRGATVRGRVTRYLRHVADLEVVARPRDADAAEAGATEANGAPTAGIGPDAGGPDAGGPDAADRGAPLPGGKAPASLVSAARAFGGALAAARGGEAGPPAPPLPSDAAASSAAGRPLARDPGAAPHPTALPGGSAVYRAADGGHVQVVWMPPAAIDVYRHVPAMLRHELPGLGDEGYRARFGGGVVARRGEHVVSVTPHLPGVGAAERDEVAARVAAAALDEVTAGPPTGPPAGTAPAP